RTRDTRCTMWTEEWNTAATRGWRANQKPTSTPPTEPITKARIDSHSVIARCFQITPVANHLTIWLPTSTGLEKKNGGRIMRPNTGTVAKNCHSDSATTATINCQNNSVRRDIRKTPPLRGTAHRHSSH